MKRTINVTEFRDAFTRMDRGNNFSYEGLGALFNYLEGFEEETGTEMELDVIALCCEFSEFKDLDDFQAYYGEEYEDMEAVENNTTVIHIPDSDSFIIQCF